MVFVFCFMRSTVIGYPSFPKEIQMKKMNILAIGAHPDDIEIGCGGTLTKYADKGHDVYVMVMTEGGQGGGVDVRTLEQMASNQIMGVKDIFWGGYSDTHVFVNQESITQVERIISQIRPDFIFCHFPQDTHQDHRHLSQIVHSATRNLRNVLFYEGPTTFNFTPHVYVDIADTLTRKTDALLAHRSQVNRTNIEGCSIVEIAQSSANFRGIQARVKFAEAFSVLRLFINI
jgi:LmbE family N-acetylglucosaminyl deacetylase